MKTAKTPTHPAGDSRSNPEAMLELHLPMDGEALVFDILPGTLLSLPTDLSRATWMVRGADLVLQFEGGGSLTLTDFVRHSESTQPPMVQSEDGGRLSGKALLSALGAEVLETAAGQEEPSGGGIGTYGDDSGELIDGVARMDGLEFEPVSTFTFASSDGLGSTPEEAAVEAPEAALPRGPLSPPHVDTEDAEATPPGDSGDGGIETTPDTLPPNLQVDPIGITNDATPTLSGSAEPGSTITVSTEGGAFSARAGDDGDWSVTLPEGAALRDGAHDLQVTASDAAGNTTDTTLSLVIDTSAPSVTVADTPVTNDNTPTIHGTAEPDSTLIIEVGGQTLATTSDSDGRWQATVPDGAPLEDGAFTVEVTATDAAGNMATATGGLSVDTQPPEILAAQVSPQGDRVSGTTEAHATVLLTLPGGDTLSTAADHDGLFEFPLDPRFTAGETLHLVVSDTVGNAAEEIELVSPSAPNAGDLSLSTAEDTAMEITAADLLAQSSDPDSAVLTVIDVSLADPNTGLLVDNLNGTWTYTPAADFNADGVILNYTVSDGVLSDSGVATIAVTPVNDAPEVAREIANQQATEDAPFAFTIPETTFRDVDNGDLTLSMDDLPAGLDFDPATGVIAGTPTVPGNYRVTVTADDGQGGSATETFIIAVANTNDAPQANDDEALRTVEDVPLRGIDVLANDSDPDGDGLTVTAAEAVHGTVAINADGSLDYTPDADYHGTDTITYTVQDGQGGQDGAALQLTIDPAADANDDAVAALPRHPVMIDVLANDTAAEMTLLSVELDDPAQGSVAIVDNQVQFTAADGVENTTVALGYTFGDGHGHTESARVNVSLGDFASVYDQTAVGGLSSSIATEAASVADGGQTIDAELYPNSDLSFTISAELPEVAPTLDLYLVQDMTGSFVWDDMPTVRGNTSTDGDAEDLGLLDDIVSGVTTRYTDAQFGIGSFNDTPNDGDHRQFQHELDLAPGQAGVRLDEAYDPDETDPHGLGNGYYGADIPESQAFALHQVALMAGRGESGFRDDAVKMAVLITDATSHGDTADIEAMAGALNEAGMRVIFLVAPNHHGLEHNMDYYQSWIDDYGVDGTVVPLASDSSNIVQALTTGIDNLHEDLTLELSGDSFGLATIGEASVSDGTVTWTVSLEAPQDGSYADSRIEFVVNDSASSQVGGTIAVNVHSDHHLEGTAANDYLQGHSGDNTLAGEDGDDLLEGLGGDDTLLGGAGNDILVGGLGDDTLSGGADADAYAFSANGGEGSDRIQDFDVARDVIRLSDLLDPAPGGDADLESLLSAGDQEVAVRVEGNDVSLEISGAQGQTNILLEGINAGGAFNGDTTLSDLIDSGLMIQQNPGG